MKQLLDDATGLHELTFFVSALTLALYILLLLSTTYNPQDRKPNTAWELSGYDAPL